MAKVNKIKAQPRPEVNPARIKRTPENPDDDKNSRPHNPIKVFAEHVTICGLEEAYKAPIKIDRIMFRIALILAFAMIFYESYAIVNQYQNRRTVFDNSLLDKERTPFPNVSICFPPNIQETHFLEVIVVPKKIDALMQKYNYTKMNVVDYAKTLFLYYSQRTVSEPILRRISEKIFDATIRLVAENRTNALRIFAPDCSKVLSNCAFDGKPFDCCRAAQFLIVSEFFCFQLNSNQISAQTDPNKNEAFLEKTGLTVDANTDWSYGIYENGSASDGFHIFIDTLPSQAGDPINIPADMDAIIELAQPLLINEMTDCFSMNNVPKLNDYDYYDPHGLFCIVEYINDFYFKFLSCRVPAMSYIPPIQCSFNQIIFSAKLVSDADVELLHATKQRQELLDLAFSTIKSITSGKSVCLPLCQRWAYRVVSASYGSIKYQKDDSRSKSKNISWSRIRINMPETTPWSHSEQPTASGYLAMCDIGGMMGVYAGFSMITFAQIIFYTWTGCYSKKKKLNIVEPLRM